MNEKVVVVFSGGQDSTICLAQAIGQYGAENVYPISFVYGQRHSIEIEHAKKIAKDWNVDSRHKVLNIDWYKDISTNALLDHQMKIEKPEGKEYPTTFVDGRNAMFLLAAAVYAKSVGAHDIMTGVSQADFSGYPDCRLNFILAMNATINLAMDYEFRIITPMLFLTKKEEWALAAALGCLNYVRENTVTCYNGVPGDGCGECPACKLRNKGLKSYLESSNQTQRVEISP